MEKASVAFCPGHISGYFRPLRGVSPEKTGSAGAGIVISEGVTVQVKPSSRHPGGNYQDRPAGVCY